MIATQRLGMARQVSRLGLVMLAVLTVADCGKQKDATTVAVEHRQQQCPPVRIDRSTDRVVQLSGAGKDASVALTAVVQNISGDCEVDLKKKTADVVLHASFTVTRGPGWTNTPSQLHYFVAVPAFYPNPAGKQTFDVAVIFSDAKSDTITVVDDDIHLVIPMATAETVELPIYVGFQLTPAERDILAHQKPPATGPSLLKP